MGQDTRKKRDHAPTGYAPNAKKASPTLGEVVLSSERTFGGCVASPRNSRVESMSKFRSSAFCTQYSLLDGAITHQDVTGAGAFGMDAVALTDHEHVRAHRFYKAARKAE